MITISLAGNSESQARHKKAVEALAHYSGLHAKAPDIGENAYVLQGGFIEVRCFNNRLHLSSIFCFPDERRQGTATKHLKELCMIADKFGAEIQCNPAPFGNHDSGQGPTVTALKKWYKKLGFVKDSVAATRMIRYPAEKAQA